MNERDKKRFKLGLLFAAAVFFLYEIIINLHTLGSRIISFVALFSPLVIGVLVALILYKPMREINRFLLMIKKRSRAKHTLSDRVISKISLVLTLLLALLLLYFVGNSVIPEIVESFRNIVSSFETYYPSALAFLDRHGIPTDDLRELVNKIDFDAVWKTITENATKLFDTVVGAVNGIANVITTIVSAAIFSIYVLANRENLKRQTAKVLAAYFKPKTAAKIRYVGMLVITTFSNFFSGQCLEAIVLGVIFFVAMTIFRFPYAVVVSVIIAITAIIPYVGAFLGCAVGAFLIFMQSPMEALFFIGMFLIIQQLENNLIYPRVVGTSVNLPAIWTFTALIVGGALFGVAGMLFFIPATSVLYTLLKSDVNFRLRKKQATEDKAGTSGNREGVFSLLPESAQNKSAPASEEPASDKPVSDKPEPKPKPEPPTSEESAPDNPTRDAPEDAKPLPRQDAESSFAKESLPDTPLETASQAPPAPARPESESVASECVTSESVADGGATDKRARRRKK